MRNLVVKTVLAIAAIVVSLGLGDASAQSSGAGTFKRDDWISDYAYLKLQLERDYSHLAWFGSPQGGVDLPALDRATQTALERANSDAEASAAITAFVAAFHDGHFAPTAPPRSAAPAQAEPPLIERAMDARTACAAFGYAPTTRIAYSLPFESLAGFALVADGFADPFRAGVIEYDGRRIGLVRIPRFRPAEFPAVCEHAWSTLRSRGIEPTRRKVSDVIDAEWLGMLAARLTQLRTRNITALIVDVGGNGGGNDLGDWSVRLFTREPIRSAPLLLSASRVAIPYFDEQLGDLQEALTSNTNLPEPTREALVRSIAEFNRRKQQASEPACDMSWVWRERRAWGTSSCTRLIASGFASGTLDFAEPGSIDGRAARALYWPANADSLRGAWNGPTYVLTDANTGSAAEMFTALIRDRGVAKTIGARTFGLGCGFMDREDPILLPHSGRAFRVPNCVRLRGDGTDEVAGIAPDLPAIAQPGESGRSLAARALRMIAGDISPAQSPQPNSSPGPSGDSQRAIVDPVFASATIANLPVKSTGGRPELSMKRALKIAERYIQSQRIDVSSYFLLEARMIEYGTEQTSRELRWFFHWVAPKGPPIEITVSMSGKPSRSTSL